MQSDLFEPTAEEKFRRYHRDNPHVFQLFKRFANEVRLAGHRRYSAVAIVNRIRWHFSVETKGDSFKMNNNYTAFYARLLVQNYPEFEDFFEFREQKSRSN